MTSNQRKQIEYFLYFLVIGLLLSYIGIFFSTMLMRVCMALVGCMLISLGFGLERTILIVYGLLFLVVDLLLIL